MNSNIAQSRVHCESALLIAGHEGFTTDLWIGDMGFMRINIIMTFLLWLNYSSGICIQNKAMCLS